MVVALKVSVVFGLGTESPPTFLPSDAVVLAVVLVVEPRAAALTVVLAVSAAAAALTFVVVIKRPPDFGVVMVVFEASVVVAFDEAVEFDNLVVAVVAVEFESLVVVVDAVEFELTVVAFEALVVAVELEGATEVAFNLVVVAEAVVALFATTVVEFVFADLKQIVNFSWLLVALKAYFVVGVGEVAVAGDMVVLMLSVIVPLIFVS